MPTIFSTNGIVMQVFFVDHAPPHIHVLYGSYEAVVDHHAFHVLEGSLPPHAMALLQDIVDDSGKELEDGLERIARHIKDIGKAPEIVLTSPWRVQRASVLRDYTIRLRFIDGMEGMINMSRLVHESAVFSALQDELFFRRVTLCSGVLTWPGGRDLAPDALYRNIKAKGGTMLVL